MSRAPASFVVFVSIGVACLSTPAAPAQDVQTNPEVIHEETHDLSLPLLDMVPAAPKAGPRRVLPVMRRPGRADISTERDPAVQQTAGPLAATTNFLNFDGVIDRDGVAPPDTNGAVGATQFVETVNTSFQVFNKATGASEYGPVEVNTLWSGFGGLCETGNQSDPVVLYDKSAGRWVITQAAFDSSFTSFAQCFAVSASSDATLSYNRYAMSFGSNLPDYGKLGTWSDAYYMTWNMFFLGFFYTGARTCALDRAAMLAGNPATAICFQRPATDFSLLPADLDGSTPPPAGSPEYELELANSNSLNLYRFHVDFGTPGNSTLTGPISIPVASYTQACPSTGTCIPQPGTSQQLDSLGDRLMHRLAYRNFGDHESLVATHSVRPGTGSASGVRWYEIRSPGTTPVVFQQGTAAPAAFSIWMGSIAMDKNGDIALGVSASSSSLFPSIGYTGRMPTDPLGSVESGVAIVLGTGSQTGISRWGDYSSMSIDPTDDCTFWYANEYLSSTGSFNWKTRIASFKFNSCL